MRLLRRKQIARRSYPGLFNDWEITMSRILVVTRTVVFGTLFLIGMTSAALGDDDHRRRGGIRPMRRIWNEDDIS